MKGEIERKDRETMEERAKQPKNRAIGEEAMATMFT